MMSASSSTAQSHLHLQSSLIEGIADDLVLASSIFVCFLALMIFFIIRRQSQNQTIHPESEDNVQYARQRLRQQNLGENRSVRSEIVTCPVCISDAEYAVETNCGHVFCGGCIVTYWHYGSWIGAIQCPVCRQTVNILLFCFTEEETTRHSDRKEEIIRDIGAYNRRFSGEPREVMDYIRDLPTLLRHALAEFFTWNGLVWVFRARIVLCFVFAVLYFISPFDIIPEAAFGIIGFFDDLVIVFMLAIYVTIIYRRVIEERAQAGG